MRVLGQLALWVAVILLAQAPASAIPAEQITAEEMARILDSNVCPRPAVDVEIPKLDEDCPDGSPQSCLGEWNRRHSLANKYNTAMAKCRSAGKSADTSSSKSLPNAKLPAPSGTGATGVGNEGGEASQAAKPSWADRAKAAENRNQQSQEQAKRDARQIEAEQEQMELVIGQRARDHAARLEAEAAENAKLQAEISANQERRSRIQAELEAEEKSKSSYFNTGSEQSCAQKMISSSQSYLQCIASCSNNSCYETTCRGECFDAAIQYNRQGCRPVQCNQW